MTKNIEQSFATAVNYFQSDRSAKAKKILLRIQRAQPGIPDVLHLLAIIAMQSERIGEAVGHLQKAVIAAPNSAEIHNLLGGALRQDKQMEAARKALETAIYLDPNLENAYYNLGLTLKDLSCFSEAKAAFIRVIEANPGDADAHLNLAIVLTGLGDLKGSETAYRNALKINDELASAHFGLGASLHKSGVMAEAETAYRRALELEPDIHDAHENLGVLLQELGRDDEGAASFRRAIALKPDLGRTFRHLAISITFKEYDDDVKAMEDQLAKCTEALGEDAMQLSFALGKAFNDLGDYGKAFAHFERGNSIKRSTLKYDVADDERLAERIISIFNEEFLSANAKHGFDSEIPIFIVGMPRSGTTLIEQILASHSQVFGAGELDDFNNLATGYPEAALEMGSDDFSRLGRSYVEALSRRAPEASRITDKLPRNFLLIGLIHMALPGAKIIHCVRDPVDTCLSCYSQFFAATQDFTYDLGDLGRYWLLYTNLMDHWRSALPGKILDVAYEDMVASQESETTRILKFCSLQWEDACLEFHKTKRAVQTASHAQVRQPIYSGAVKRWRRYKDHLGPLLEVLS